MTPGSRPNSRINPLDQPLHSVRSAPPRVPNEDPLDLDLPHRVTQVNRSTDPGGRIHARDNIALGGPAGIRGVTRSSGHVDNSTLPRLAGKAGRSPRRCWRSGAGSRNKVRTGPILMCRRRSAGAARRRQQQHAKLLPRGNMWRFRRLRAVAGPHAAPEPDVPGQATGSHVSPAVRNQPCGFALTAMKLSRHHVGGRS
jgi:hypothetical protein